MVYSTCPVITGLFYCVRLRGSVLFYLSRRNCLIFYLPGSFFIPVSILLIVERICRPIFQFFVTNPILFHFFVLGINYIVWTMDISFYFDRYIYIYRLTYITATTGQFQNCLITSLSCSTCCFTDG